MLAPLGLGMQRGDTITAALHALPGHWIVRKPDGGLLFRHIRTIPLQRYAAHHGLTLQEVAP